MSWLWTALLTLVVFVRDGFAAIQACNPPDTLFAIAWPYKLLGVRFVFDQHDLCPEIFAVRFGSSRPQLAWALRRLERATYRTADRVISTNESYRAIALRRGAVAPITSPWCGAGPIRRGSGRVRRGPSCGTGARTCAATSGSWVPRTASTSSCGRPTWWCTSTGAPTCSSRSSGFGECEEELRRLAGELGIADHVTFTGRADDRMITDWLSTADLGISPDPHNDFNDASTMNKTLEYMAMGLPVAAFDLTETRVSAGEAAEYASADDVDALAKVIVALLDDPARRAEMGRIGRRRIEESLGWHRQAPVYAGVYDELLQGVAS